MNNDKRPVCLLSEGQACSAWAFFACCLIAVILLGLAVIT